MRAFEDSTVRIVKRIDSKSLVFALRVCETANDAPRTMRILSKVEGLALSSDAFVRSESLRFGGRVL